MIPKLIAKRNDNNVQLRQKLPVSLVKHRKLRHKIVAKKLKLNQLKQKLENLNHQLDTGIITNNSSNNVIVRCLSLVQKPRPHVI